MAQLYTTVADVLAEAKLQNFPFVANEVENVIEEVEVLIENYTDKNRAATPTLVWLATDREWLIIKMAARIGSAGFIMQRFANQMENGQLKIDNMYKILKNIVYGEGSGDGSAGTGQQGDVMMVGGAYENADFELLVNADINKDSFIGDTI